MHKASEGLSAADKLHEFVEEALTGHNDDDDDPDTISRDALFDKLWTTADKFVKILDKERR